MKIVGSIQVLKETDTVLKIDSPIAGTMRLQPKTTLDAMVLVPPSDVGPGIRKMTLIVTPLPEMAWGHLLRMSLTLKPSTGSLEKTVRALQELRIFCRHIETVNGVNLRRTRVYGPDRRTWEFNRGKSEDDLLIPSTLFVLEVQENIETNDSRVTELHRSLRQMIEANQCNACPSNYEVVSKMETLLKEHVRSLEVDWISPMSTLNRLAQRLEPSKGDTYRRFSQRMLVSKSSDCLQIDLSSLRHLLWDLKRRVPYQASFHPRTSLFVQGFADSDEQVMCWDFYEFQNDLVVQFDVTTPTAGLEHRWWEWIYSSICKAEGNILASASSARIDGQWGILRTTVVFPFKEGTDDIDRIVHCFRVLQGDRGHTPEFRHLIGNLRRDHAGNELIAEFWKENEPSFSSILQNVEVWDPGDGSPMRGYFHRFSPNPFNFTLPLDLNQYQRLYGKQFTGSPNSSGRTDRNLKNRQQLAKRVIERMFGNPEKGDPGENIAIVGAHRAGKTTVLNLVEDILVQNLREDIDAPLVIPVRLNAAVDPPHMFFITLIDALQRLLDKLEAEDKAKHSSQMQNKTIRTLSSFVGDITARLLAPLTYMEIDTDKLPEAITSFAPGVGAVSLAFVTRLAQKAKELASKRQSSVEGTGEEKELDPEEHALLSNSFKESLLILRDHLAKLDIDDKVFVIVDEFSETSKWGNPQSFPVLRHVIESRDFSRIKWLFSASRPVSEATEYSPITNVLFEYNVGPLRLEESERMIDAFGASEWQEAPKRGRKKENKLLQPVIMHQARLFLLAATGQLPYLLQVSCYHIYDRAVRTYVPLIGRTLCIRIILEKVLPELSDYFAHQWREIHPDARHLVRNSLLGFSDQRTFLTRFETWIDDINNMPSGFRKALERSGLRGEGNHSVAPLVACWILTAAAE